MNNKINYDLQEVKANQKIEIDGISFSNIAYILIFVDGTNLFNLDIFKDSFLVFSELKNSATKSGKYLLFTGVSGIADDSGWEYVEVLHKVNSVRWNIRRDDVLLSYTFDRTNYLQEISEIEQKIQNLNSDIKLEPLHVVYPE